MLKLVGITSGYIGAARLYLAVRLSSLLVLVEVAAWAGFAAYVSSKPEHIAPILE